METLLDVVRQTDCASEGFILLERELISLVGRIASEQVAGLRLLLKKPFPADADNFDRRSFYSECLGMAITTGDMELVVDVTTTIDGLVQEGD